MYDFDLRTPESAYYFFLLFLHMRFQLARLKLGP